MAHGMLPVPKHHPEQVLGKLVNRRVSSGLVLFEDLPKLFILLFPEEIGNVLNEISYESHLLVCFVRLVQDLLLLFDHLLLLLVLLTQRSQLSSLLYIFLNPFLLKWQSALLSVSFLGHLGKLSLLLLEFIVLSLLEDVLADCV